MKDKNIVIVGGAGFIGHNLSIKLKSLGANVSIIDGLNVNNLMTLVNNKDKLPYPELSSQIIFERMKILKENNIDLIVQDARDYNILSEKLSKLKPQIIIHLAAVSHSNRSNKDPHSTFDHSLRTLENVLDFSKNNIEHFIYFSSSMVYGNFNGKEVDEKFQCNPIGIYGALKYAAEKIVTAYNQVFDLPYTIIRPSALYGERCISRRVSQIFIENAINNREITINGSGDEKLDFTYIQDLISGVTKVIESENSKNEIFNLTYGNSRKINDLIKILQNYFPNLQTKYEKKENFTPERGTLSISKAKKLINYKPSWSIEDGYKNYIEWYIDFYNNN